MMIVIMMFLNLKEVSGLENHIIVNQKAGTGNS